MITGEFESFARGRGDDLYLIREYMPEDSARHVDWKATAKSGSLKVREFSREDERKLRIVFDNPGPGNVSEQAYENAVTAAASLGWHFAEANAELSFAAQDYQGGRRSTTSSNTSQPWPHKLGRRCSTIWKFRATTTSFSLLVPAASIPANLWACSYFIFIGTGN